MTQIEIGDTLQGAAAYKPKPKCTWSAESGDWVVSFPCCDAPDKHAGSLYVSDLMEEHECHPVTPDGELLRECRRWLYTAVYDKSTERRRRAAALLLVLLENHYDDPAGGLFGTLADWMGRQPGKALVTQADHDAAHPGMVCAHCPKEVAHRVEMAEWAARPRGLFRRRR